MSHFIWSITTYYHVTIVSRIDADFKTNLTRNLDYKQNVKALFPVIVNYYWYKCGSILYLISPLNFFAQVYRLHRFVEFKYVNN